LNIEIICVGNLKEKYWKDAVDEYSTRLSRYTKIQITEIKEYAMPAKLSPTSEKQVKDNEGVVILKRLRDNTYVIALDIRGRSMSSEKLASKINTLSLSGRSDITFIIGGSLGLSQDVLGKANMRLSFSDMTFPHQMMRVILLEQIYRAFKINRNETYHK
jgi:23S rRNA (pseudouridine1915-N3)-methyltransferase